MKTRTGSLALSAAFAAMAISLVAADDVKLPDLEKHLAEKNYYPALEGLKDAQADVKCNIFDQVRAAFPDAADKPIAVKFYWSRPSPDVAPKKKFAVNG